LLGWAVKRQTLDASLRTSLKATLRRLWVLSEFRVFCPNSASGHEGFAVGNRQFVPYANYPSVPDPTAHWRFTTGDNRDNIWLSLHSSFDGWRNNPYNIEVRMNGETYTVSDVRVDECGE
jgi:hypothetical protein